MWINACQRQVDLEQIYSTDKPADGRLINPKLNIVALQFVVVLRIKLLTTTIRFFISFMIEGGLRLGEPLHPDDNRMKRFAYRVKRLLLN